MSLVASIPTQRPALERTAVGNWRPGWLAYSILTFAILICLTILFWSHSRSVLDEVLQARVAQGRSRMARRIKADMQSVARQGRQLCDQIATGIIVTPSDFIKGAKSVRGGQTAIRSLTWISADAKVVSTLGESPRIDSDGEIRDFVASLRLAPEGRFYVRQNPRSGMDTIRTIAFPVIHEPRDGSTFPDSAVFLTLSIAELIDADLPADNRLPRSTRVEDQEGRVLMASGGQSAFLPGAPLPVGDVVPVLDQWWTFRVVPSTIGARSAWGEDGYLFLIEGFLLATLAAGTVAHVGRSRQRVQETTRAHLEALETLHQVAGMIAAHPCPSNEVLEHLMKAACRLLRVNKAFVCLTEPGDQLRLMYHVGFDDTPPDWTTRGINDTRGIARCIRNREAVYVPDVLKEPASAVDVAKAIRYNIRALLMLPLAAAGEIVGVMVFADRLPRKFTEEERRLARLWASQSAVTLINQRLANASDQALRRQQQLNEQVQRDAQAKEMLLREMNHRVKNNMAGIVGLLSAGSPALSDEAHRWLDRAISRIQTLARAHELFVGFAEKVSLLTLIDKTLAPIHALMPPAAQLVLEGNVSELLSTDKAVTLAMVLHELATNALEHGIGPRGVLTIRLGRTDQNRIRIEIVDDGSGVGVAIEPGAECSSGFHQHHTGLGLQLVGGLVGRELHGTFNFAPSGPGTVATVEFPATAEGEMADRT